jgi:hypothetical protein
MEVDIKDLVKEYKLDSSGSGCCPIAGTCHHGNESAGSIKSDELLDHQTEYYLF